MVAKLVNTMAATLAEWLLEEIDARHMSIREFARFCNIGNQTLNNILDPRKDEEIYPSIATLIRLAQATNTDLCTLVAFIAPDATRTSPRARLMAERIDRLSPEKQEIVDRYLLGTLFKESDEDS